MKDVTICIANKTFGLKVVAISTAIKNVLFKGMKVVAIPTAI